MARARADGGMWVASLVTLSPSDETRKRLGFSATCWGPIWHRRSTRGPCKCGAVGRYKQPQYALTGETHRIERRHYDLVLSRVRPFLNPAGLQTRTLEGLMAEAYITGMKDAIETMAAREGAQSP